MSLDSAKALLLDCDNNLIAFQQARRAVMRSADPKNPRLFVHASHKEHKGTNEVNLLGEEL